MKKFLGKITFFKNLNLIQKFLLTYCILILVPLTTLFGYTYTKMSQIIESNILESTKQAFDQSIDFLTYKIYRIFDISNSLAIDENIPVYKSERITYYPAQIPFEFSRSYLHYKIYSIEIQTEDNV